MSVYKRFICRQLLARNKYVVGFSKVTGRRSDDGLLSDPDTGVRLNCRTNVVFANERDDFRTFLGLSLWGRRLEFCVRRKRRGGGLLFEPVADHMLYYRSLRRLSGCA